MLLVDFAVDSSVSGSGATIGVVRVRSPIHGLQNHVDAALIITPIAAARNTRAV